MRQLQQQRRQACRRRIGTAVLVGLPTVGPMGAHAAPWPPLDRAGWIGSAEPPDARRELRKVLILDAAPVNALPLLRELLAKNFEPRTGKLPNRASVKTPAAVLADDSSEAGPSKRMTKMKP